MKRKSAIIFSVAIALLVVLALFVLPSLPREAQAQVVSDPEENDGAVVGWMWSSNIGWIRADSNSTNPVKVNLETGEWSGYAWSSSLGWIDFNPATTSLDTYPQTPNHGVKTEENDIIGWARACSVFVSGCSGTLKPDSVRGSWDGWIKMVNVVRDPETGGLNGFAWGSLNLGWLSFGVHSSVPPGGCSLDEVDTNCDGTPDCDPCVQTCVPNCGSGGPGVVCRVEPGTGDLSTSFTWYVESLSGFTGDPESFTYDWTGDDLAGPGVWDETLNRQQISVTYPEVGTGTKTGSVTVTDSFSHSDTADCSNNVTITSSCTPDGETIPLPPEECCNLDIDGDGLCGSCQISIDEDDYYGIELYFSVISPRYDYEGTSFYRSATNQKVTLAGSCGGTDITASSLPSDVHLICSRVSEGPEIWGECNDLAPGDYWVGVYAATKPNGITCQELNLSTGSSSGQTEVCFTGSAGN